MAQAMFWSAFLGDYVTRDVKNIPEAKKLARSYGANRFRYYSRNGERDFSRATFRFPWQEV